MAWRAGPCFNPAGKTQPIITSSISFACKPERATASLIVTAPSSGAGTDARLPWKPPIAVRAPFTITISVIFMLPLFCLKFQNPKQYRQI